MAELVQLNVRPALFEVNLFPHVLIQMLKICLCVLLDFLWLHPMKEKVMGKWLVVAIKTGRMFVLIEIIVVMLKVLTLMMDWENSLQLEQ